MIGLDRLMKKPGVVVAGQFSDDGKTIRFTGHVPEKVVKSMSRICAENNIHMRTEVIQMADISGLKMTPLNGWMIWCGKYAIFVVDNTGIIVETKRADFNQLMVDMFVSGPTGPRLMPS
jgi:roadblock/LC7 domain-containing protein